MMDRYSNGRAHHALPATLLAGIPARGLASVPAILLAIALASTPASAGTFLFATNNDDPDLLTHGSGYTGSGGELDVKVCISPGSGSAAEIEVSVMNAVDRFNQGVPTIGNLRFHPDVDMDFVQLDFESTLLHELGHCQGLAHPNMANESGLNGADREFTKTTGGGNGSFDLGAGGDGVNGSPDDQRGDDVNFHWFEVGVNDPFLLPLRPDIDSGSFSVSLSDLPGGDSFVANGDRTVSTDIYGLPQTEAIMQQGTFNSEVQRGLAADDVATLAIARAGRDRTSGTNDDYTINLVYGGVSGGSDCDITVELSGSGFAVCQISAQGLLGVRDQFRITGANARFGTADVVNWHFSTVRVPAPERDSLSVPRGRTQTVLDSASDSLLENDSHPEDATLVLDDVGTFGGPDHGAVELNGDGTFSYTHDGGASTTDFFVYRTCVTGTRMCAYQYVDVTVTEVPNTPPVANDDEFETDEDSALAVDAPGVLDNDTDADDQALLVFDATAASSGTLSVAPDGSLSFQPVDEFSGEVTFSYRATDGQDVSGSATVTIVVKPVNDPPMAVEDVYAANGDDPLVVAAPGLLANDTDVDDEVLTARVGALPGRGSLVVNEDGSFTYTPGENFTGGDAFTYFASDGELEREAAVLIGTGDLIFDSSFEVGED